MIKTNDKEIKKIETTYSFYCDDCGKYLGQSIECEDGYVEPYGEFIKNIYIDDYCWYGIKKTFCNDCRIKFINSLVKKLREIGFSEGNK